MMLSRERQKRLLAVSISVILVVYLWIFITGVYHYNQHDVLEEGGVDVKTIFVWDRPDWLFMTTGPTVEDFEKLGCDYSQCRLVDNQSFPVGQMHLADSVLFTIKDFFENPPQRTELHKDQIWLFWIREAPLHYFPIDLDTLNDKFNLTATYLRHPLTDIHSPMGKLILRPPRRPYKSKNEFFKKKKAVAWVVSNCDSRGQRDVYVEELSKYITVDIFGRCGQECPRKNEQCIKMIERDYFFYLAFESMYCQDYVTEKMYRTLSYDIVPVGLGGANYSQILPHKSYLDVRDYRSPRHLAKFMKSLMEDMDEYKRYFEWKKDYLAIPYCTQSLCDLCEVLHTPGYPYKSHFHFEQYWDADKQCLYGHREKHALNLL